MAEVSVSNWWFLTACSVQQSDDAAEPRTDNTVGFDQDSSIAADTSAQPDDKVVTGLQRDLSAGKCALRLPAVF